MRKPISLVLAALAAATSLPAAAETSTDNIDAPAVVVKYADLNLASPEGAAALDRRIERALARVCERPTAAKLASAQEWEACRAEARKGAMEQLSLGNPFDGLALASLF